MSVFWDAQSILFINFLEKRRTINNKYYIALLVRLKEEIIKKRPQRKKKVLFHQENAPCHKSIAMMAKLHELHFCTHPILQIWSPNDYRLFEDLKRMPQRKRFGSNEEVISETETYFQTKDNSFSKKRHRIVREALESVYHWKETMLMNKVEFCLNVVVLLLRPETYWVMCYIGF